MSVPAPDAAAPVRVALIGTRGFGTSHLRNLARLEEEGVARLVGVVDVAEPPAELQAIHHRSLGELLDALSDSAQARDRHHRHPDRHPCAARDRGARRRCSTCTSRSRPCRRSRSTGPCSQRQRTRNARCRWASRPAAAPAWTRCAREVAGGALGTVTAVHVHGAWQRDRAYYARSAWAGKRRLADGRRVADGVATNPLAHAVHAGLAIAGIDEIADIAEVTTELRRAHDIQADDTTFLRIDPVAAGPAVVCALTTTAPAQPSPWVEISGPGGSHRLFYTEDRSVHTMADGTVEELTHERMDLMENLIDHVRDREVALLSPLAATGVFSAVLEAIQSVPDPLPIETGVTWVGEGAAAHPVVDHIEDTLQEALEVGRPFSELGVSWAREDAVHRWTPPAA